MNHYNPIKRLLLQDEARQLFAKGLTPREIADRLGVSVITARQYLREPVPDEADRRAIRELAEEGLTVTQIRERIGYRTRQISAVLEGRC